MSPFPARDAVGLRSEPPMTTTAVVRSWLNYRITHSLRRCRNRLAGACLWRGSLAGFLNSLFNRGFHLLRQGAKGRHLAKDLVDVLVEFAQAPHEGHELGALLVLTRGSRGTTTRPRGRGGLPSARGQLIDRARHRGGVAGDPRHHAGSRDQRVLPPRFRPRPMTVIELVMRTGADLRLVEPPRLALRGCRDRACTACG